MTRQIALWLAAACLAPGLAFAAVDIQVNPDGSTYTAVQVHGPSIYRYDIVFVGDGFRAAEQDLFNARVADAVAALEGMIPYSERMFALNIWRVNVISDESGVDHPVAGISKNTELDCRYGNPAVGEAERCITSASPQKCFEAASYAPDADAVFVLVNDTQWGGCAGSLVFSSISPGFAGIITHELGHKIGLLADEYSCWLCDGSDDNNSYTGLEPDAANATTKTVLAEIKWSDLITVGTPLPTTVDTPPGVLGLWEGAVYNAQAAYRPQSTCHMRATDSPFCGVCEREMRSTLEAYCNCCVIDLTQFIDCKPPCGELRWRFPEGCPACGDFRFNDEILYILDGADPRSVLQVLDDHSNVIAQGRFSKRGGLEVTFEADRSKSYIIELKGAGAEKGMSLKMRLFRNGKSEELPGATWRAPISKTLCQTGAETGAT